MLISRNNRTYNRDYRWLRQNIGGDYKNSLVSTSSSSSNSSSSSYVYFLSSSSLSLSSSSYIENWSSSSSISSSSSSYLSTSSSSYSLSSSSSSSVIVYNVSNSPEAAADGDYIEDEGFWHINPSFVGWSETGTRSRYHKHGTNYYIGFLDTESKWYVVDAVGVSFSPIDYPDSTGQLTPPTGTWHNSSQVNLD